MTNCDILSYFVTSGHGIRNGFSINILKAMLLKSEVCCSPYTIHFLTIMYFQIHQHSLFQIPTWLIIWSFPSYNLSCLQKVGAESKSNKDAMDYIVSFQWSSPINPCIPTINLSWFNAKFEHTGLQSLLKGLWPFMLLAQGRSFRILMCCTH